MTMKMKYAITTFAALAFVLAGSPSQSVNGKGFGIVTDLTPVRADAPPLLQKQVAVSLPIVEPTHCPPQAFPRQCSRRLIASSR
jgi:hypothetical protein